MHLRSSLVVFVFLCVVIPQPAWTGTCRVDEEESDARWRLHLSQDCTDQERRSRAVPAAQILERIKRGKSVDLARVVVKDDLRFDDLVLRPLPDDLAAQASEYGERIRSVSGALSLTDSTIQGAVRHGPGATFLMIAGPVTLSGTRFEQAVDLSQCLFLQPVTLSGAVWFREAYFVKARFRGGLIAEKTAFGPHTRFHRARFHGPAAFRQARFTGLAEFLEVEFEQGADFSGTSFALGTGFSGSRFRGPVDFSGAQFAREAFFTFTVFEGDASFKGATFHSVADFDDAQFQGRDDFSRALFEGESRFVRVKRSQEGPGAIEWNSPQVQYAVTLLLLVFSAVLLAYLIRSR
ncbi:MAG TPA: pentapeptide repeat-containing protein [Nitrospira sp.]|nr:pentapeptide repeat-containing protein [Nitrospira sp.]